MPGTGSISNNKTFIYINNRSQEWIQHHIVREHFTHSEVNNNYVFIQTLSQ